MKKTYLIFALALALFVPGAACADTPPKLPTPVIAVVDVQRILQESLAAKSVQGQLEAQRSKFQNEIEKEENSLREAEKSLSKQRGQLSPEVFSEREQQLRTRFTTVQNHVQARRKVLDKSFTDSMNAVRNALLEVVGGLAKEHGANIVMVKQQAIWTDPAMDVTDEVLKRLDQKMPKIEVATPPETPEKK